ncbi:MAG: polysaccharide deacetylase family protein [Chloroflexi bacterium]|nr:polysaccharide deacetylase family protein [Chloroflexota bacterium]
MTSGRPRAKLTFSLVACAALALALFGCRAAVGVIPAVPVGIVGAASVAPTEDVSSTSTGTPPPTPTLADTATATLKATASPTATSTPTPTATPSPTATPVPWPTPDGIARTLRVPILMYHYISAPPADADKIRLDLSVPPDRLEEHLQYLRGAGYTGITLHDLALALQTGHPLPDRPIVLTFDDGHRDHYTHALPLLQRHGFVATFFLITAYIDEERPEYLTWDQVIAMHEAGMEIESHCYTHVDLRDRDVDYLVWQMLGSKEAIEARTGRPVRFFCYPAGKYDELAMRVLHSANYWGAVTVNPGAEHRSDAMFELQRVRIHGDYSAQDLAAVLRSWESDE